LGNFGKRRQQYQLNMGRAEMSPLGSIARFKNAIWCNGDILKFCSPACGEPLAEAVLIAYDASFDGFRAEGVDTRLKADDRISEFRSLGGAFAVQQVDEDVLDDIAVENDLTLVATGKLGLSSIFPRDESRSFFRSPQSQ
jgi:hypothetical protein